MRGKRLNLDRALEGRRGLDTESGSRERGMEVDALHGGFVLPPSQASHAVGRDRALFTHQGNQGGWGGVGVARHHPTGPSSQQHGST